MKIAEPLKVPGNEAGPDMWRALASLADTPTLVVRGGRSDILSARVASRMVEALGSAELVTVEGVGHAPTLTEPELVAPIDRLLAAAMTTEAA
jgi:pimeloyl-ACP methyl ester carboxylesterase